MRPGISALTDHISFINTNHMDATITLNGRKDNFGNDNDCGDNANRLAAIIMHEVGHSIFTDHKLKDENWHVPGTIMSELPMSDDRHDTWMINKLKELHN
jgi:hypothetical protein